MGDEKGFPRKTLRVFPQQTPVSLALPPLKATPISSLPPKLLPDLPPDEVQLLLTIVFLIQEVEH